MGIKMNGLSVDLLSHPGETLEEVLESNNMTQKELAARINISQKHINQIIKGVVGISSDVAFRLGNVFTLPASFWNNLQSNYDQALMEIKESETVTKEEIDIFPRTVYKQLCLFGYLNKLDGLKDRVIQTRKFLGLSSLTNQDAMLKSTACFRKSEKLSTNIFALIAWMKICEIESDKIALKSEFNVEKLRGKLDEIKALNVLSDVNEIVLKLTEIFASCGIAFSVVRGLTGAPVNGMVRKVNNKVRLCITLRNAYADIIWFSLCHEIGHILNMDDEYYIEYNNDKRNDKSEINADNFARNMLLPDEKYDQFVNMGMLDINSILAFADKEKIMPSILIGRLQHDNLLRHDMDNELRIRYKWA